MGRIPGYQDGSYSEEPQESWDDGLDAVGDNPTGRKCKSSSRQRRKKIRKLFRGTQWDDENKGK